MIAVALFVAKLVALTMLFYVVLPSCRPRALPPPSVTPTFAPVRPRIEPPPVDARNWAERLQLEGFAVPPPLGVHRDVLSADPVEHQLLAALRERPADDDARMVYADWLEEHGQAARASYVRGVDTLADILTVAATTELGWRAITSRERVQCSRSACPKRWDAMTVVAGDERQRSCPECARTVRYCANAAEADESRRRMEVAVLDLAAALPPRREEIAFEAERA